MAINQYSRYVDNVVTNLVQNGVSRPTIVISPPAEQRISFRTYSWKAGDQIELLAYSAYGDEQSWWLIADANPQIMYWDSLPAGTELRVPNA